MVTSTNHVIAGPDLHRARPLALWRFSQNLSRKRSCESGRAFRVGFGPGSGLKLTKISGLNWTWDVLFVSRAQKYNQNNLATLLNFLDLTYLSFFFGHDLGLKLVFGFGLGLGLYFRVWAGFGSELVGPFTTLLGNVGEDQKNLTISARGP